MKLSGLVLVGLAPVLTTLSAPALTGCSGGGSGGGTGGGKSGGGTGGGGSTSEFFTLTTLDPDARDTVVFAAAVDADDRIGAVYFTPNGIEDPVGVPNYDLKYVEFRNGTVSTPERLRSVQRMVGLSLAFDPLSKEPVVAFLGGAAGFMPGDSIFWFQSDAAIMRRLSSTGLWRETDIAIVSAPPACSSIDQGFLPGLWPTVGFNAAGRMFVVFRDGHNGQFPQQDWASSDVELMTGASETALVRSCLTGDHKQAYGGRLQVAIGEGDLPAIVYDQAFGGADTIGNNVLFQRMLPDAGWSAPAALLNIADTMTGATLAYHPMEGFGIAVTDRATSQLSYIKSATGASWTVIDPVFGSGTGGWYPSLAMDPINEGEPAIAFYVCSARAGVTATSCLQTEDELRITQRIGGNWQERTVDTEGGWAPKLKFLSSGKRAVVYRTPAALDSTGRVSSTAGVLKLAVEK
ncbi:MAG: hypothetical protein JNG84_03245 [Archangium sp.]|nr:hypothetical protein [Archangium sp.]